MPIYVTVRIPRLGFSRFCRYIRGARDLDATLVITRGVPSAFVCPVFQDFFDFSFSEARVAYWAGDAAIRPGLCTIFLATQALVDTTARAHRR